MRKMSQEEIMLSLGHANWANICTTCEDGSPYAIEATPFSMDDLTCFMINPRGGTWRNLQHSDAVLLKYTVASQTLDAWLGISCFGTGGFIGEPDRIREGWRLLGKVMGQDYSAAADRFSQKPTHSPLFAVKIHTRTGRVSSKKGEALPFFSQEETV